MPYDGKILARARAELDGIRRRNQDELSFRTELVYRRAPEIKAIDAALRSHMAELVRLTVSRSPELKQKLDTLREENLDMQMRRAELLTLHGFGTDYLDEIVSCPLCRDTGIYKGAVCSCLDRLYNAELTKELATLMRRGDESFEKFDLSLYPKVLDARSGLIPRDTMEKVLDYCRAFASGFTRSSPNLLFQGGTGLGKTFLSACIARTVSEKGFSVCYESASAALELYEKAKFGRDTDDDESAALRIKRMESCDLMILDDLGTEMVTPMSQSALYTLVNSRLVNGRTMIISTNLSGSELKAVYKPQISSRLLGEFRCLPFVGEDIRQIRKG